jgi:hypothetical protein
VVGAPRYLCVPPGQQAIGSTLSDARARRLKRERFLSAKFLRGYAGRSYAQLPSCVRLQGGGGNKKRAKRADMGDAMKFYYNDKVRLCCMFAFSGRFSAGVSLAVSPFRRLVHNGKGRGNTGISFWRSRIDCRLIIDLKALEWLCVSLVSVSGVWRSVWGRPGCDAMPRCHRLQPPANANSGWLQLKRYVERGKEHEVEDEKPPPPPPRRAAKPTPSAAPASDGPASRGWVPNRGASLLISQCRCRVAASGMLDVNNVL